MRFSQLIALISLAIGCAMTPKMDYTYSLKSAPDSKDGIEVGAKFDVFYVELTIVNKSSETIRLITDESVFTSVDGRSIRLVEGNTTLANRSSVQPPIIVPKGATVTKKLYSAKADMLGMGVVMNELLLPANNKKKQLEGKVFHLLLTFSRGGQQLEKNLQYIIHN